VTVAKSGSPPFRSIKEMRDAAAWNGCGTLWPRGPRLRYDEEDSKRLNLRCGRCDYQAEEHWELAMHRRDAHPIAVEYERHTTPDLVEIFKR
jgi:hypothetical protein